MTLDSNATHWEIGLITEDAALAKELERAVESWPEGRLTIASTAAAAMQLLSATGPAATIIDFSAQTILPARFCLDGFADELLLVERKSQNGRPRIASFGRNDLFRLAAQLRQRSVPAGSLLSRRILGSSSKLDELRRRIESVARFPDISVLLVGETGTGKQLASRAIHDMASGGEGAYVAISCATIPENLFESELFGHEAGAMPGATTARPGLFEVAKGGTVFLDEVADMPASIQMKLVHVLESRQFRRLGSNARIDFDARVISATNASQLGAKIRPDLYYRLCAFQIATPALREHTEDLPQLAEHFLNSFVERHRLNPLALGPGAIGVLSGHAWPGNVRELRSVIEQMAITAKTEVLDEAEARAALASVSAIEGASTSQSPPPVSGTSAIATEDRPLREVQRELVLKAFHDSGGNLSRAARQLKIPRSTLRDMLRRYHRNDAAGNTSK